MIAVSDEVILKEYKELKSVWKVAKKLNLVAQTVHRHLVKMGIQLNVRHYTEEDLKFMKENYQKYADESKLEDLAKKLGRNKTDLCFKAKSFGLTHQGRKRAEKSKEIISRKAKERIAKNGHPKGMLGKKHTEEAKRIFSEIVKKRWKDMSEEEREKYSLRASKISRNIPLNRKRATWKCDWREIGGKKEYYRSSWEANYARYLQWLKERQDIKDWEHEAKVFWFEGIKRGCMSYLPDFKVTKNNLEEEYHEVKGWMDSKSITKINRMRIYFPEIKLIVIDRKGYYKLEQTMGRIIQGWEFAQKSKKYGFWGKNKINKI